MNFLNRLRKFFTKKNYTLSKSAVIYEQAEIFNNLSDKLAISIGDFSHVKGQLLTFGHGGNISVGEYCYIGENSYIWSARKISIGDRVLVSHNVNIFDNSTHPVSATKRHQQFKSIITVGQPSVIDLDEAEVKICDDVLIGCMAVILKGVTIGEGAIVGASSVVTKDVPPYTIVAGNPAKVVREIPENER